VTWAQWRAAHPDGWVLSRDTGNERSYGRNPYPGYDDPESDPFLFDGRTDSRLPAKDRVVGLGAPDDPLAVRLAALADERVMHLDVAGEPVVVWAVAGLRSALQTEEIAGGRELATTGAFRPLVDGKQVTFEVEDDDTFTDSVTGSTWDVLGRAIDGPSTGAQLDRVGHIDTFWFAWAAFYTETRVVGE